MKPSDVFVGIIEFFSALVPGAIAIFLLITSQWSVVKCIEAPNRCLQTEWGSLEGWAVFLVAAYVLGQLIVAIGSITLDPFYDHVYARWRRIALSCTKPPNASPWDRLRHWLAGFSRRVGKFFNFRECAPDDALLSAAKALKEKQLGKVAQEACISASDISNTFWWAGTVVRMRTPYGAAEIDNLSALSKLFRGMVLILPLVTVWKHWPCQAHLSIWVLFVLSLWRFMWLRWGATERTYEYFIAATLLPPQSKDNEATV